MGGGDKFLKPVKRKVFFFCMEFTKRRRGRPRTGRSLDSPAFEKLSRAIWCGSMDHQKNSPYVEIFEGKEFIQHLL